MPLKRLTHERYARMRMRGEWVDGPETPIVTALDQPCVLARGGRAKHPNWYAVHALVKHPDGAIDVDFVTEAKTLGEAIQRASEYRFRAVVISPGSRREFDNGKAIEDAGVVL